MVRLTSKHRCLLLNPDSADRNGGAGRDRTDDLLRAKQALSQLSYSPSRLATKAIAALRLSLVWSRTYVRSRSRSCARLALASESRRERSLEGWKNVVFQVHKRSRQGEVPRRIVRYASGSSTPHGTVVVGLGRFELPTSPLSGVRSNQLSYRPKASPVAVIR